MIYKRDRTEFIRLKAISAGQVPLSQCKPALNMIQAIPDTIAFSPTLNSTLIIPSPTTSSLILLNASTSEIKLLNPFPKSTKPIRGIAFSPVVLVEGVIKGGLCAVVREGSSEVGLVGLESPNRYGW
jgi:hypothetical protein